MNPPETRLLDEAVPYTDLIGTDRVHASLYYDPRVFADEIDRIWRRDWLYVGHESEIPEPGDYRRRELALVPVVMTRGQDDTISVLINRCPHRGNMICLQNAGNARVLRCAYHGWTFRSDGELVGVTFPDGYGEGFGKADRSMSTLPRVATYRGLVFASFEEEGESLEEYLGAAKSAIDLYFDRSPTGNVRVVGEQKIRVKANWKMALENSLDGYHPNFVHRRVHYGQKRELGESRNVALKDAGAGAVIRDLGGGMGQIDWGTARAASAVTRIPPSDEAMDGYRQALVHGQGEQRANEVLSVSAPHLMVFPNLFLIQNDFRVWIPVSPRETIYCNYFWALEGVDPEINELRVREFETLYGGAGCVLADDLDVFERNQAGLEAAAGRDDEWIDLSRGLNREHPDDAGFAVGHLSDETGQRGLWRSYRERMLRT